MPWRVMDVLDERTRFVLEYDGGSFTMAELCRIYGIARKTGYVWVERYEGEGLAGLKDRRYGAGNHPNQTASGIEEQVLQLKQVHPSWGAKKLRAYLLAKKKGVKWPVVSTFGEILRREGLSTPQRKRLRTPLYTKPFEKVDQANRVWCADFKGWFRTEDGTRIDPLTITDAHSRYLLRCQAVEKTDTERVQAIFAAAFGEYGLPEAIRSDNGAPFAARAVNGVSRLSLWWMKLGIRPERIQAGHPEQNGRHERMHRTLKQETASPPAATARAQQRSFDRFRREYNEERPHEALAMETPSAIYRPSAREYPARVPEPEYGSAFQVRRVAEHGQFRWKCGKVFLSDTLAGEPIGLLPIDERFYAVYFAAFPIARFDSHQLATGSLAQRNGFSGAGAREGEPFPFPCIPSPRSTA